MTESDVMFSKTATINYASKFIVRPDVQELAKLQQAIEVRDQSIEGLKTQVERSATESEEWKSVSSLSPDIQA